MDVFEVRQTLTKGRSLFAKQDIKAEEKIFEEEPIVSCQFSWNKVYDYKACDFCMSPLETAEENAKRLSADNSLELPFKSSCSVDPLQHVKCFQCGELFCSQICLDKANELYHSYICIPIDSDHPLKTLEDAWKNMHYPPETCSINLLVRILAIIKSSKSRETLVQDLQNFASSLENKNDRIAHKMLGDKFAQQLESLYLLLLDAVGHDKSDLEQFLTPEGFRSLFAIIATNAQGIGTSSFANWVKAVEHLDLDDDKKAHLDKIIDDVYEKMDKYVGTFLNCEGSGLYKLQSTINHSCVPNAQITFPFGNHKLVLESIRDIKKGEEICISYVDECVLNSSRYTRQRILSENYIFICTCEKCELQAGDPDVTSEEESDEDVSM
ncbi:SET and MYND domain-containing protein 5 [Ctenocephalides felis]|uniref:SET and MYND domain-containing protein 5 n=1 Tax=Ctenocephalides felis TaxID=7515 RepID=UPI000E6E4362|nr:SET and MYND domain-containing protein 5 [Ctenocephalides felis]